MFHLPGQILGVVKRLGVKGGRDLGGRTLVCPAIDQQGSLMGFNFDIRMPMEGGLVPDASRIILTRLTGRW